MTDSSEFEARAGNTPDTAAWQDVLADMDATADAYEDAGWDVIECHPGAVTVVDGENGHLDVLIPDNEYEPVEDLFDEGVTFTEYEVLQAVAGNMVYIVVVMEDPEREQALLYPAYYEIPDADTLLDSADADGLHVHLRRLDGDYIELVHEDPGLFAPNTADNE